ncbi:MAG: OB-fold domain-containing protein [Thermodesulfobacteriota bacterium]
MSKYLPDTIPFLEPVSDNEMIFWEYCNNKRLMFPSCVRCGLTSHPSVSVCPECQSIDWEWHKAPGTVFLYTYTIAHYAADESIINNVPYNVAVVIFPQSDDLRFVSNIVDIEPEEIFINMELELIWQPFQDNRFVPRFKKKIQKGI